MNKRELISALIDDTDIPKATVTTLLDSFESVVTKTVKRGEPVMLAGFCKFARVDRPARMGRNPQTGETIKIKAKRAVRVTALKKFKDAVMTAR